MRGKLIGKRTENDNVKFKQRGNTLVFIFVFRPARDNVCRHSEIDISLEKVKESNISPFANILARVGESLTSTQ